MKRADLTDNIGAMVIAYVTLAILGSAALGLYSRHVLQHISAHAYALANNLIGMMIFLPIALTNISYTNSYNTFYAILISACVWGSWVIVKAISIKNTHASINAPLGQSKILWALLFGLIFLGEAVSGRQILGVVIIFLGLSILMWHPEHKFGKLNDAGVRWTLLGAFISALTAIADKFALNFMSLELYGFIAFLSPTIMLAIFTPKKGDDIKHMVKNHKLDVLFIGIISGATYYATLKAYSLLPITIAYPVLQLGIVLTVIGGIFFLKEKEHVWQKIIAAILVILGSAMFKLS